MKLEDRYTTVTLRKEGKISYVTTIENDIFIDLDNLDKYTIKQLISINNGRKIGNAKKKDYLSYIRKNLSNSIIENNREYKLNKILNK